MNLPDYLAAATGGWIALAATGGASWALIARRLNRVPDPEPASDDVPDPEPASDDEADSEPASDDEADCASYPPPVPPFVRWAPYLPPVPPSCTQAEIDATWAAERRDVDDLEQSIFDRLFTDQIAAEGLQ